MGRTTLSGLATLVAISFIAMLPASAAAKWSPGPERYGIGIDRSVPIEMKDGTILRADVYYPTDAGGGRIKGRRFPVLVNQTPYGKRSLEFLNQSSDSDGGDSGLSRSLPELVRRGYINVIVDIRGTGRSRGTFKLLDPQQGRDGAEVVRWVAKLPGSNGRVGLYGPSYMAMIQYHTAANLPRRSPLKAMLPVVSANGIYREFVTTGGIPAGESDIPLFAVYVALPLLMPLIDEGWADIPDTLAALERNIPSLTEGLLPLAIDVLRGGETAYDEDYWRARSPGELMRRVSKNKIPALMAGGWRDVFQRGSLMNYAALQNRAAGRAPFRPMSRRQQPTSRYQVFQGDWTHVTAGDGFPLAEIAHRWFDTWLKRKRGTGLRHVKRPVRLYDMTRKRWVEAKRYPFSEAKARTWYLNAEGGSGAPSQNDGGLSPRQPAAPSGADTLLFTGISSPCSGSADQYALGLLTLALESAGLENPCVHDDRTLQVGPGALTYTTEPMTRPRTLAGPIGARIYATSTRPEVSLIATLEDVSPSGASRYLTSGALLGSHRALDRRRSWRGNNNELILPHHPYTRAAQKPVPTGDVVRYDIEIFPVLATLEPGHRLRLTLTSVDTPHLTPIPSQMEGLVGGVHEVQRNAAHASRLTIPMTSPGRFKHRCHICR